MTPASATLAALLLFLASAAGASPDSKRKTGAPPRRSPAAEKARAAPVIPADQRCASNAECVISCDGGCCGAPCGCRTALNRTAATRLARTKAARCRVPHECPAVACAYEPADDAECVEGRCVARSGLGIK